MDVTSLLDILPAPRAVFERLATHRAQNAQNAQKTSKV
jgi:hypothetical protein